MSREENTDREPDLVLLILDMVSAVVPGLTPEQVRGIEQDVRGQYGGIRVRIAKRGKHPTPERRKKIMLDALDEALATTPTDQIAQANGISRRSLYRYMKNGA